MERTKITPYRTKTGIQIGRFYERKQSLEHSYDMERLQEALLVDGSSLRRMKIRNIAYLLTLAGALFFGLVVK
jgi:hypothetical protein